MQNVKTKIDKDTKNYRKKQIERVQRPETEYLPAIKITNAGQETNYLSITFAELERIKQILILTN